MPSSQVTPAPVWFNQSLAALNCCSKWLILLCTSFPVISTAIPLYLISRDSWLVSMILKIHYAYLHHASGCSCRLLSTNLMDRHGIDFGYRPIIIPWNPSFRFTCHAFERDFLWCLKQRLPQNNGPSHSPSPNVFSRCSLQLGCIMLSHARVPHFCKLS